MDTHTPGVTERTKGSLLATRRTVRPGRSDCHSAVVPDSQQQCKCKRARVSRYGAETIGCHEWNEQASSVKLANTPRQALAVKCKCKCRGEGTTQWQRSGWQLQQLAAERGVMLGERMPARAVEPDKGGRGVPIWMPNPAAARMRGISCNPDFGLLQGIASLCRRALQAPFHRLLSSQAISRRRQPWVLGARC
jgi:hypothetical protein